MEKNRKQKYRPKIANNQTKYNIQDIKNYIQFHMSQQEVIDFCETVYRNHCGIEYMKWEKSWNGKTAIGWMFPIDSRFAILDWNESEQCLEHLDHK